MSIPQKHFQLGYALYIAYLGIEHCQNDAQRKGWWAALNADADCETAAYLSKVAA